jgi:iron complex outermembrane recepter protein
MGTFMRLRRLGLSSVGGKDMRGRGLFAAGFGVAAALASVGAAQAQSVADLRALSIGELESIDVSSVTKTAESLSDAPAAIYVITHDAIMRSGAVSLPEILRLAPNLHVIQISASRYIVTARGFSGNIADQNFANKLLVLIDGRSVYTPLFSGVYWDMQDVLPDEIERIEVISGPGATLWGANAVNGVINVITRKSSQSADGLLDISAGNLEQSLGLRYGGRLGDDLTYRLYARGYIGDDTETVSHADPHDNWSRGEGGFRLDWVPSGDDTLTLQGDAFWGANTEFGAPDEGILGHNILARWNRDLGDGSSLQIQGYYDRLGRGNGTTGNFWVDTYDLDVQHTFNLGARNQITWGGGVRIMPYQINGVGALTFSPASRTLDLSNAFVQDSVTLTGDLTAVVGLKLEDDPFSGLAALPSARLSWKANANLLFWGAASRAIRSPTPFEDDVVERSGSTVVIQGNPNFEPETLTAYELGARAEIGPKVSLSVSTFYNFYDDLRSIELAPPPALFTWGNKFKGRDYGAEIWADYQVLPWWRLSASFEELAENFERKPGSIDFLGIPELGDDPENRAALHSSMQIGEDVGLDADLRYVGVLPDPHVPAYVELNASVGWNVSRAVRLSLSGFNLLHAHHQEFPASEANAIPRSFAVGLQWRF